MPGVLIDICSACRSRCRFCLTQHGRHRKGELMSVPAFKCIVDIVRADGYNRLHMYCTGEPLLHPDFHLLLGYAVRAGFDLVQIATKLQAHPRWVRIHEAITGPDVCPTEWLVGIDAVTRETLEAVSPGADIEYLMDNAAAMPAFLDGTCARLIASTMDLSQNQHEHAKIKEVCEGLGYSWQLRDVGTIMTDLATPDDVAWFRAAVPQGNPRLHAPTDTGIPASRRTAPCADVLEPCIHPNGDVSVCCHDQLGRGIVGNVLTTNSLTAVLNSQPARDMLAQCRAMTAPFCVGCA